MMRSTQKAHTVNGNGFQGRWLAEQEVADVLGLNVKTLRAWRLYQKGPRYAKFGRAVRYLESDIRGWAAARVVEVV